MSMIPDEDIEYDHIWIDLWIGSIGLNFLLESICESIHSSFQKGPNWLVNRFGKSIFEKFWTWIDSCMILQKT